MQRQKVYVQVTELCLLAIEETAGGLDPARKLRETAAK